MGKELQRILHGGYDLLALKTDCAPKPHYGTKEEKSLRLAAAALRQEQGKYRDLLEDEKSLPDLENKQKKAKAANTSAKVLEQAIELQEASENLCTLEQESRTYPKVHQSICGNELERVDEFSEEQEKNRQEINEQQRNIEKARVHLQTVGNLATDPPTDAQIDTCKRGINNLRIRCQELKQLETSCQEAKVKEQQESENLGNKLPLARQIRLHPEDVGKAEKFARYLHALLTDQQDTQQRIPADETFDDISKGEDLPVAEKHLHNWLSYAPSSRRRNTLIASALGLAASIAVSLFLFNSVAMLSIIPWLWILYLEFKDKEGGQRRYTRTQFEACRIQTEPKHWQTDAVRTCLNKVRDQRISWEAKKLRHHQAEKDTSKLATLETKIKKFRKANSDLTSKLDFDPMLVIEFDRFIRLAKALDKAKTEKADYSEQITQTQKQIYREQKAICSFLSKWTERTHDEDDIEDMARELQDLCRRAANSKSLQSENARAHEEIQRIQQRLKELEEKEDALYQKLGIEPCAEARRAKLECLLDKHENWKKVQKILDNHTFNVKKLEAKSAQNPNIHKLTCQHDREELETQRKAAISRADEMDGIKKQITQIRTRVQEAEKDGQLITYKADEAKALMRLEDKFDQTILRDIKSLLLEDIRTARKTEHEPQAIKEANTLLKRFTHNKFSLELDESGEFRAHDLLQDKIRKLGELSTATRMQFLIAVRIAWMRQIEGGGKLCQFFSTRH